MFEEDIMKQNQDIFFGGQTFQGLSDLSGQDIGKSFAQYYDFDPQDAPASMFGEITPEMLKALEYDPTGIQAAGQSMLPKLLQGLGGSQAQQMITGSGAFQRQQQGVKDVYGQSMANVIGQERSRMTQARTPIRDIMSQWHEVAQSIKGY